MIRRLTTVIVAGVSVLGFIAPVNNVFAAETTYSQTSNYQKIKNELMGDGLTQSGAQYYAQLQGVVGKLESEHRKAEGVRSASNLTDEYVRNNQDAFRKNILNLNPTALKKGIESDIRLRTQGIKDLQALIKQDKKEGINLNTYKLTYPDGSSIKATFKTVPNYSGKLQTDTADPGPWTQSALLGVDGDGDGNWVSTTQWEYQDGVSYSKVEDQLNWTESNKGYSNQEAVGTLDQGSEASYGVVQVNTFSNSNMPYTTSTNGSSTWVQGYTDVFFQVSSSFSASYAGLSISVSSGGQWHQFAVTEAAYDGSVDYSQAQYT